MLKTIEPMQREQLHSALLLVGDLVKDSKLKLQALIFTNQLPNRAYESLHLEYVQSLQTLREIAYNLNPINEQFDLMQIIADIKSKAKALHLCLISFFAPQKTISSVEPYLYW